MITPAELQLIVNSVSVIIMTFIALDTWYQDRFHKKSKPDKKKDSS